MQSKNLVFVFFGLVLISACSHKNVKTTTEVPPALDSDPMNFDAEGSDSKKIEGLYTVHFNFDNASLSSEAKDQLSKNATWLKAHSTLRMQIEGHCDERGTIEYNLALGERRSRAAMDYLIGLGIPKDRLSVISFGKEKPLTKGDHESDYAQNRRDNFVPVK